MKSTYSSILMLNQEKQVIMSDYSLPHATPVECDLHHSGTDLDADGHYCTKDASITEYFVGDHDVQEFLSKNAPKEIQWKTKMGEIKIGCNSSTE